MTDGFRSIKIKETVYNKLLDRKTKESKATGRTKIFSEIIEDLLKESGN